tara:strand:- start:5499 stop:6308 length:810 start_codon:yes stop_codon:yes gene_type:complete
MLSFSNICFYGGGAWGQALAIALASLGYKSTLIVSDKTRSDEINSHISKKFPGIKLSHLIKASVNANEIINESDLVFVTTESKRVMEVVKQIFLLKSNKINLVITSKGFATKEGNTFNEIIKDQFPTLKTGILTGPTFADEIANNLPAAAVLASNDVVFANSICSLFQNSCLRLYQSNDPIGASLAGAVKNIIAIGAGMIEGLNLGDNAKAALITRGISELSRLIKISGGNFNTAFGLAGIGDMSLTCSGPHSRNMAYGMNLVKGNNAR